MKSAPASDSQIHLLNPLANKHGDTTQVSAALGFLSTAMKCADPAGGLSLSYDDCCGLSHLLDTCAAALSVMNQPDYTE